LAKGGDQWRALAVMGMNLRVLENAGYFRQLSELYNIRVLFPMELDEARKRVPLDDGDDRSRSNAVFTTSLF
jgi:hypothetical protein